MTRMLCTVLAAIEEHENTPPRFDDDIDEWWSEHKEADAAREYKI